MSHRKYKSLHALIAATVGAAASLAHAQSAFTYQGTLDENGAPANGTYDMRFSVWNDPLSGPPDFQFGFTQTLSAVTVEDGLFTVSLNLGNEAYESFDPRFLQIEVRESGGGGYTELAPRSPLDFAPRSVFSLQSSSASALDLPLSLSGPPHQARPSMRRHRHGAYSDSQAISHPTRPSIHPPGSSVLVKQ